MDARGSAHRLSSLLLPGSTSPHPGRTGPPGRARVPCPAVSFHPAAFSSPGAHQEHGAQSPVVSGPLRNLRHARAGSHLSVRRCVHAAERTRWPPRTVSRRRFPIFLPPGGDHRRGGAAACPSNGFRCEQLDGGGTGPRRRGVHRGPARGGCRRSSSSPEEHAGSFHALRLPETRSIIRGIVRTLHEPVRVLAAGGRRGGNRGAEGSGSRGEVLPGDPRVPRGVRLLARSPSVPCSGIARAAVERVRGRFPAPCFAAGGEASG